MTTSLETVHNSARLAVDEIRDSNIATGNQDSTVVSEGSLRAIIPPLCFNVILAGSLQHVLIMDLFVHGEVAPSSVDEE